MKKIVLKKIIALLTATTLTLFVLSPVKAQAVNTADYKLIDFSNPHNVEARIYPVDKNTGVSFNHTLKSVRIVCENTVSRTPAVCIGTVQNGTFGYGFSEEIPVKEYTVIAVRLKLSNPDLCFNDGSGNYGRFDWTTDTYVSSGAATPWRDMSSKITLEKTTAWQTVYVDTNSLTSAKDTKWLSGNWAGIRLLFDGDAACISDSVDIKWIGFFADKSDIPLAENQNRIYGDINSDYRFNLIDLVRIKKYFAHNITQIDFENGDIDDNQCLNSRDMTLMKRMLLGEAFENIASELNEYENAEDISFPVSNGMTAEESSSKINNLTEKPIMKLRSESVMISQFDSEWAYSHHGYITAFKGKLYAMWSSGHMHEDDLGQRVMYAYSSDFYSWSEPVPLADSIMGENSECYLTPMGFFVDEDTIIAYYRAAEYNYDDLENGYTMRPTGSYSLASSKVYFKTSKDGISWTEAEPISIYNAGVTQSRRNRFGRWIWSGSTGVIYSDNTNGTSGWHSSSIASEDITAALQNGAVQLCEANWYQTDDYVIHLLMRSNSGYLWQSESYDNGESWSAAYPTRFTDDNTMCYFGTLPDGRYYYIGSPLYSGSNNRAPLMLCISENGYDFDEQYIVCDEDYSLIQNGYAKGGIYGYPECAIYDGYIYIIYSLGKEIMQVTRIKLDDIKNEDAKSTPDNINEPYYELDFSKEANCSAVMCENGTTALYDSNTASLKIETYSDIAPAMIYVKDLTALNIKTADYPVIAFRIKKENYNKLDFGSCYFSTDYSVSKSKRWVQFKSPKYWYNAFEDDDFLTVAVDASKMNNYYDYSKYPDNLELFDGCWDGFKIGFAKVGLAESDSTFYIKSIGFFESFWDAWVYYS